MWWWWWWSSSMAFPLSLQSCTLPHPTPMIPQPQTKSPSLVVTCEKAFTLHRNSIKVNIKLWEFPSPTVW